MFYFAFLLDWKIITDPKTAADVFRKQLLITEEQEQPLRFSLDLREDLDEQDREIISLYKRPNVNWARPFSCMLRGRPYYFFYIFYSIVRVITVFL